MDGGSSLSEGSTGIWLVRATGFLIDACEAPRSLLEELERTGSAPQLPASAPLPGARAYVRRLESSRLSVMCAALAAEAAVNAYVHAKRPAYHAILEKLTTLEKLALAPRLLSQSDLFPPGSRVYGDVERLFELRDALVHPWPRARGADDSVDGGMGERFNPSVACELLEAVARIAKVLGDLYEHPYRPAPALALKAAALLGRRAAAASALPAPTVSELAEEERLAEAAFVEDMIGA
jgi:hypothetical protein